MLKLYQGNVLQFDGFQFEAADENDDHYEIAIQIASMNEEQLTASSDDKSSCLLAFTENPNSEVSEVRHVYVESTTYSKKGWIAHCLNSFYDYPDRDIRLSRPGNKYYQVTCSATKLETQVKTEERSPYILISTPDASQYGGYAADYLGQYKVAGNHDGTVYYQYYR